ncbi:MAG: CheB methylesterase [Gallionellaceae bacterium]|nr:MAG: CheB methylesterase [Gallionellaceae bacterium]
MPTKLNPSRIIVVGSSTGGTEALRVFLAMMPKDSPPILIAQHMPEMFVPSFAARLDGACEMRVKMAEQHEIISPGNVYLAPGHSHLSIERHGAGYRVSLSDAPPVNRHRPSIEVLFKSAAKVSGPNTIGVMLTGMGRDGAAAMLEMRQAGAYNLAQDEASSVVFGMPRAAIESGAVHEVVALERMAERVLGLLRGAAAH